MLFVNRRHSTSRIQNRTLKNISFTLVMMMQAMLWAYVLLTPATKSLGERKTVEYRKKPEESIGYIKQRPVFPRVVKQLQAVNGNNNEEIISQQQKEMPIQVETALKPQREQFKDLAQENKMSLQPAEEDFNKYYNRILHHTILHRDASVILNNTFILNPTTLCTRHEDLDLLVIVHTAPYNFRRRSMIRQHITDKKLNLPYNVQPVFMLGSMSDVKSNISSDAKLKSENNIYNDIVMMDFIEDFRNLSLKATMWLKWTNEHCRNANIILKIDDDVVIDIQKILPLSRGLFSKHKRSIFCHLNKIGSQPIPRTGRTQVDPREFMRMSFYPYNYCSGFIVFLTPDIIPYLYQAAHRIPFYNVDDVYMFGMVPKYAGGVTYHNIGFNVSIWNKKVLKCNLEKGVLCPYFGTMGEEEEDRINVWDTMKNNHARDFHYPQLRIL